MSRSQRIQSGPKLPKLLADQLGLDVGNSKGSNGFTSRTDRRRLERRQKKGLRVQSSQKHNADKYGNANTSKTEGIQSKTKTASQRPAQSSRKATQPDTKKRKEKVETKEDQDSDVENPEIVDDTPDEHFEDDEETEETRDANMQNAVDAYRPQISRTTKDRLAQDDAEIEALERRLGIKKKSKGQSDPLADILQGLDDLSDDDGDGDDLPIPKKRKSAEDEEWLQQKRRKVIKDDDDSDAESFEGFSDTADDPSNKQDFDNDLIERNGRRENPYVAPNTNNANNHTSATKYVPPSLRAQSNSNEQDLIRLGKRTQGLINRLTESNLPSIVQSFESMFQENARQHVTSSLINALLSLIADVDILTDNFLTLHAGFIAALYRQQGADFGAQLLEKMVLEVDGDAGFDGKRRSNLVSLLAGLYNFQVVGNEILYDLVRSYLDRFSEDDTELILRIIRICGSQLRHDNQAALGDIVTIALQKDVGALSVRQSFMVETMNDLKRNKLKAGVADSASRSEQVTRIKKMLGAIRSKSRKNIEPLRVTLNDIRNADRKGRWWLVGASFQDPRKLVENEKSDSQQDVKQIDSKNRIRNDETSETSNLLALARQLRMTTEVHRTIFVSLMTAIDHKDAVDRIIRLKLKKTQMKEVCYVILRCVTSENSYNPYYGLVAENLCEDRNIAMSFQFSLWDYFKKMGESLDDQEVSHEEGASGEIDAQELVHIAKFFSLLLRKQSIPITCLKRLDFAYLQPKTIMFLETLLSTVILDAPKAENGQDIVDLFGRAVETPNMVLGFQYFLSEILAKSSIPGKKRYQERVADVCRRSVTTLSQIETAPMLEPELTDSD